jgi:hypothetical protein
MTLFDGPTEPITSNVNQQRRKRMAVDLLEQFSRAFPTISYRLVWHSHSINAQAWRIGSERYVTVYGGLVRHPKINRTVLALAVAHETGHHLGGDPKDPERKWMSWQGQADYWAASVGMYRIFGSRAEAVTLRAAKQFMRFLEELEASLDGDEPDLSSLCRYHIICAALAQRGMPDCALLEFKQSYSRDYPDT